MRCCCARPKIGCAQQQAARFICICRGLRRHGLWGLPKDDPAWQRFRDIGWNVPGEYTRSDAQRRAALLAVADRSIGEVLDLLGELGIADSTLVILSGDNGGHPYFKNRRHPAGFFAPNVDPKTGARFRGGKGSLYEGGLRIPLFWRAGRGAYRRAR